MNKPRVLLLTRLGRPSGLLMAQVLRNNGVDLIGVVAEKRLSLVLGKDGMAKALLKRLRQLGFRFARDKILELMRGVFTRSYAGKNYGGAPVTVVRDHHGEDAQAIIRRLRPDILVLCNTRKIRPELYSLAGEGAVNLHASLLPRYAGLESVFWALFHREREIGFTVHRVNESLDAGDILLQRRRPLKGWCGGDISVAALQRALLQEGCQATAEVLLRWDAFKAEAQAQSREGASYFGWPTALQRRWFAHYQQDLTGPQPLKVLHLITRMVRGGAQENTLATVMGLRRRGWDTVLATGPAHGREGDMREHVTASGVPVAYFAALTRNPNPLLDIIALFQLWRFLRREKFLIVHTHTSKAGVLGRLAAKCAGVPVVLHTPHGHVFGGYFPGWVTRAFAGMERLWALFTDGMIALTPQEKKEHLKEGIGREHCFEVIPSGVPEAVFDPDKHSGETLRRAWGIAPGVKVVGTLARLVPVKGVDVLIEAFAQIAQQRSDCVCVVVGDGPERDALQALACSRGLGHRVLFTGYRKDAASCLAAMDVFVLASRNEGMGRALVQAGLMQRPIIGSAVSGIQDLIRDGENGILLPPERPDVLAAGINRMLENGDWAQRLGRQARADFLNGYGEEAMIDNIERLYLRVLKKKGIPGSWVVMQTEGQNANGSAVTAGKGAS